jgi:aryl-alcohol dehydrogenase-like predicted oxidoreductase
VTGPKQAETIERALEVGGFGAVQATWTLLERAAGSAPCRGPCRWSRRDRQVALANGRLTACSEGPELAHVARGAGTTPDALALPTALAQPWADVVLSGAAAVEAIESNLAALELELDPELLERLNGFHMDPVTYWQTRAELPWN